MEPINYKLEAGNLNQVYEKIINCKVTTPNYIKDEGFFSGEFFLDKRLGLISIKDENYKFTDHIIIKGVDYYYANNGTKSFIFAYNGTTWGNLYPTGFDIDSKSPLKIIKGKGPYGARKGTGTFESGGTYIVSDGEDIPNLPGYTGGYFNSNVTMTTGTVAEMDYILYTGASSILRGGANKVYVKTDNQISVLGVSIRGNTPKQNDTFSVYSELGNTILVGHKTGYSLLTLNGITMVEKVDSFNMGPVVDITNYDQNIFVLTESNAYFSRSTFDDNTQFHPLDVFKINNGKRLFSLGKSMLVFADDNLLISGINTPGGTAGYVGYSANYNGSLFSKYSQIFADQTIHILQDDKQLMQVDLVQHNSTTFDLVLKNIMNNNRGVFNEMVGGEVFINNTDRFLDFLHVKDGKTTNYQFDKQYNHWLINKYNVEIYRSSKTYNSGIVYLCNGHVCKEEGYTDLGIAYGQECNFAINGEENLYRPNILRTLFGLVNNEFDITLKITFEIGGKLDIIEKRLNGFNFDTRLSNTLTGDELLEDTIPAEQTEFNGSIVSIQSNILKLGRYINFKYYSNNRFILGPSYVITDKVKTFINEYFLTN